MSAIAPTFCPPTWRQVLLPTEHGVWGILASAGLAGLIAAPTGAGLAVLGAGTAGVMARHAIREGVLHPARRNVALRALAPILVVALALFLVALDQGAPLLVPAAGLAAAFGMVHLGIELQRRERGGKRPLFESILGGATLSALAGLIVLAGGGTVDQALGAGLALAAYAVTGPVHVRHRLRPVAGPGHDRVVAVHLTVMAVLAALVTVHLVPLLALAGFLPALARAAMSGQATASPLRVGLQELVVTLSLAIGTGLGLLWRC